MSSDIESDGLTRRTLKTVAAMLGGAVVILGTASLIALLVTSKAVGASSATAQASADSASSSAGMAAGAAKTAGKPSRGSDANQTGSSSKGLMGHQPGNEI